MPRRIRGERETTFVELAAWKRSGGPLESSRWEKGTTPEDLLMHRRIVLWARAKEIKGTHCVYVKDSKCNARHSYVALLDKVIDLYVKIGGGSAPMPRPGFEPGSRAREDKQI